MTLIRKLASLLESRVAAEAEWQRLSQATAKAATEFEYQRLAARWTGADGLGAEQR